VAETVFAEMKLIKDNSFDKDAYAKMIDSKVKDEQWKQPLKDAFDQCHTPIVNDMAKIHTVFSAPPFEIKKEECDAKYLAMFVCLHLESFVVSINVFIHD
jgi:hypothetical protein